MPPSSVVVFHHRALQPMAPFYLGPLVFDVKPKAGISRPAIALWMRAELLTTSGTSGMQHAHGRAHRAQLALAHVLHLV
jgi:hypothetical protein